MAVNNGDPTMCLTHAEFRRIVGLAHDVEDEEVTRAMKRGVTDALREYERIVGPMRASASASSRGGATRVQRQAPALLVGERREPAAEQNLNPKANEESK